MENMSIKKLLEAQQATLRQQDQIAKKNGGSLNTGMTSQEYAQYANNLVTGGAGINNAYGLTDDQKYGYTKDDNWITSSVKFLGGGQADLVNLQNEDKSLIQTNIDGFNAFRRGAAQATLTGMNAFSSMGDTSVADNLLGSIDATTLSAYYAEKSGKGNAQTKALLDKRYQNDLYNYSTGEAGNFNKMSTRDIITKGLQAKESAARINGGNGYGDGRYGAQGYYGQGAIAKHNEIKEANRKEWNVAGIEKEAELDWSKGNYLKGGLKHAQAMLASGASSIESVMDDSTILSQTLGEQLPTVAVLAATRGRGAAGKTFGHAAVASDNVSRAHSTRNQEELKLFEERQGNVTQNERTALKAMAYGHATLDFVGDKLTAKAFGGDKVAGTTIQKLIQKGKNAATATVSEGITEGIQTHIETNGFRLRNEFDAAAVGEGAAMGAMAGGVYGSAPFVTGATGAAVSKAAEKAAPTVGNAAGHFGNFVKAFKAKGTMEDQLNPENADTYNPANVVSQSLKTQRNTNATAEDLANSNNNIQDAMDITTASLQDIDDLITQRKSNETRLSDIEQQATELMTWLEENSIDKQDVDAMSDNELDNFVTNYEKQEALFESLTREHGELDNSLNTTANLDSLFQQKQKLTIDAENVLNQVTRDMEANIKRNRVTDIDATLQTVNEDNQNDLVSKILSAPNLYTEEVFDKLINNSAISEDNKVLLRAFKDSFSANEKASKMDVVNSHVIKGNKKLNKDGKQSFVGLNDYTARISAALNMGNKSSAEYQLDLLDNFNQSHQGKSKAITEAFNRAESAGTNFYVIPQQDGKWGVTDSLDGITPKELRDAGGFDIHRGSAALVGQVSAEAKAIQASYDALSKLIDSGLVKPAVRTKPSATRTNVVAAAEAVSSETKAEVEAILKEETRENVIKAKEVVTKAKQAKAKQEMGIEETPVNALRGNQPKPIKPIKVPKDFEGRTPSKEVPTYNTDDFTGFKNKEWISGIVKTLNRMNDGKQGVNRFIGFSNSATNGRTDNINLLTEHFRGKDMANITQSYGADYKPSDVVAVGVPFAKQANADKYLITPTNKPAYKRNGRSVDTDAINKSKAMYKELYSAAYSGAAILLLSGNAKQNAQQGYVTAQAEIEQFLKDMGYQKGGYTRSSNQNDQSLWILPDVTVIDGKTHKATVTQEQEVEEELDIDTAIPEAIEATGEVTTESNTNTPEDNQAAVTESVDPLEDNDAATDTVDTVTPIEDAIEAPTIESLNLSEADILAERQVPIQKRNRVKAYFYQKDNHKLLTQVPNAIKKLASIVNKQVVVDTQLLGEYLGREATPTEIETVKFFINFETRVSNHLAKNFTAKPVQHSQTDLVNHLASNGVLDRNIASAMAVSIYEHLAKEGLGIWTPNDQLAKLHGMKKDTVVNNKFTAKYGKLGGFKISMSEDIGKSIVKQLGLDTRDEASIADLGRLQNSLGALAVQVMIDLNHETQKLVNVTKIPMGDYLVDISYQSTPENFTAKHNLAMQQLSAIDRKNLELAAQKNGINLNTFNLVKLRRESKQPNGRPIPSNFLAEYRKLLNNPTSVAPMEFIKSNVVKDKDANVANDKMLARILADHKATPKLMTELFGAINYTQTPVFEKPESLDTRLKNRDGFSTVPVEQQENLIKSMANGYKLREGLVNGLNHLYKNNTAFMKQLLGIGTAKDLENYHIDNRENIESTWDSKWMSFVKGIEWAGNVEDKTKEFYMGNEVWAQNRIGYTTNTFNPQLDSLHRAMAGMSDYTDTVDPSQDMMDADGMPTLFGYYLLGVSEGIEKAPLKFETEGLNYSAAATTGENRLAVDFLPYFKEYIDSEAVKEAALLFGKVLNQETITTEQQQKILDILDEFGTGNHSIGSLYHLSLYHAANGKPFEHSVGNSSDGKNNGIYSSQVQLGYLNDADGFAAGGLHVEDIETQEAISKGMRDIYERGADISIRAMRAIVPTGIADGVVAQVSKAIHGLDKSYGTRKGFKVIMTPFNYAAGIARLAEAVVDKSMATINESFEAVHKGDMELKDALSPINNLLQAYNKMNASIKPLDTKAKFEEINEFYQTMYLRTLSFSVSSDVEEIITQPSPYITDADGNSEVAFSNIKQLSKFINANFTGANTKGSTKSVTDFLNEHFKNELNKTKGSTDYVRISEIEKVGVLNFRLTNQQEDALVSMLNLTRGIATVNTMVSYKPFMEVRNQITQRAGRMFAIYDTLHTAYYAKAVDGLDKTDSTPEISHVTKAQHREIEAKLNRYIPRLMPATNMNNRKDTKANLVAVKSALKYDVTETSRTVARYKSLRDGDTSSFTLGNSYRANINPGVGMLAAAAQSMDALVASDTMGHFPAFDAHDSATVSGRNAKEAFIHQNKVYFKALSEYHIELEFFNSEIQMFRNLVSAYEKGDLNTEDLKGLYDSTFDKKTQTGLSEYVGKTVQYNLQEARDRLNTRMDMLINQIKSVHQFTGIGGKYNITEADIANLKLVKEKANKDIDKLAKEYTQVAVTLHGYIDTNVTTDSFDSELANGSMDTGRLADYLLEKGYGTNSLVDIIKDAGKHVNFNIKMMDETDAISYSALGIKGKSSFFDATSNTLWINSNVPVNKRMSLVVKKAAVVSLRNRLNVLRKNPSKENIELLDNLTKDTRSIIKAMRESGDIGILQDIKDVNASVFTNIEETIVSLLANKKVVDFASNQQADRATVNARVKLWKSMESLVNRVLKLFGLGKVREVKDIDLFNLLKTDTQVSIREANQYAHNVKSFDINTMDSEIALGNRKHTGKLYRDFIANSKAPLSDLLQVFRDSLVVADSKTAAVYSVLLDTIDNHLDNNTVVRVISTAKELQEYIGSIPLTELESLHPSISTGRAYYYPRNKEVVLFALNNSNSDVSINPEVVTHELFHAVTANKLTKDTQSVKDITVLREKLIAGNYTEDIAAVVGRDLASDYKYALTNNDEFISTILASPVLANALARISHEPVSMDDFSKRIAKVMGIRNDNVLAAYYNYVGRLLNTNMDTDVVKQPTVHNAPPSSIASTSGSKVKGMTPHEVYEQLGGTDTRIKEVFDMYLEPMLAAIDPALITGVDGVKVWNKAMRNGKAVYASTLVSSGFQLSDAEMYAAEVIEVAMNESFNNNAESMAYRELFKTYEAAQRDIKPEDMYAGVWANATQQEKDIAQKQWDFLFKPSKADVNANRYLSRFVALTIASPEFANTLDRVAEEDPTLSELSGFDRVVRWFSKLVEWMFDMSTGTRAYDTYKDNINTMADKLADIDSRYRNRANGIWLEEKWQEVDDKVSGMFGGFANKNALFTKLSNMKLLKNNIIGSITGIAGRSDTIDALPSEVNKTIDALSPNQYLGTMRSILTEIGKYTDTQKMVNGFLSLTKNHEQHKQFISEQTRKVILSGFEKKGKKISKQLQTAITYNVLRTDLQVLANHYGNGSLAKLFNNSAYLDTEISKLEKTVTKHNYGKDKLTQAKKLADFMVTGNARTGMVTNPSAIAAGWGTSYKSNNFSISESNEIDRLISMYALRDQIARTNPEYITAIVEELNRSPDNGITRAIEIHSRLVKESKELFLDNPMSYVKGYMPDIVNKNIELQSVPTTKRAELEKKGWQYVTDLHPDTVDTNIEPMVLMLIPDSGVQRVTSGALVLSDTGRKGTDNNSDMQASIKNMIKYMDTQNKKGAVLGGVANGLVPTFDVDGNIIGLRYLMNNATKDNYLQRNNDFSRLLGSMAAMNIDKVYSKQENADLLDALHDDYKANFSKQANQYVEISATAPTAKGREIFRMMSWHSRQHVYNTWPDGKMYVSNRVVDSVFGYVNPSITSMFKKDRDQRNTLEKIITDYAELFIGDTAELRFAQVERAIQDITRTFKDFIVIRNFETMWNNIVSNTFLLMTYGVNPVFIAREGKKALQHGLQYRKDRDGLTTALIQLSAGIGDRADLEAKVIKYEEAIKRNPIRSFIEDDHMQSSIVEDVALMADHYEYESPMGAKITELREKYLNETANNVIDTLLVAPNTPMYKFLALATSEGDFVAKYVMHQWFSKAAPKKDRVSHERALEMAQEAFINYDIPHSATIQYLNNMGVWMFTKYNIRIQKAILYLMANKPGRLAFSAGVMAGILGAPSIASESVLNNIGNPLGFAPTNALSMFGEPLPIKVISDVVF